MRLRLAFLAPICIPVCLTASYAQSTDASVKAGLDVFAGALFSNYAPINSALVNNGYSPLKNNSARFGIGGALCGPLNSKLPLRAGIQALINNNENIAGNNRTSITSLNVHVALEVDVVNKGPFLLGPLVGVGVLTSNIEASKDNQVGSFNGYISGNARGVSLNHLTFPVTFGGRIWLRVKNSTTKLYKRQGFALSGGYLLPLDGQNWYWANNVALPNGPNQKTGNWFIQLGFGVR